MTFPSSPSAVQSVAPVMSSALPDERFAPPSQFLLDDVGVSQENLEFARFEQQDSALASWLLSSVSPSVLPHLIGLDRSLQIWNAHVSLFHSKTTSQLMFYRRALHSQRKADLSMKEFLMKIKGYCGEIISEREDVTTILNGLSSEYESSALQCPGRYYYVT
ncbi:hypothetical protein Gogos_020107 [Gossypium gossypioides]|uniref:Uncharacterized protein n=1 Tax=Gossypium gossypioides TaxID=34282 RepID=A0A7J9D1Z4_GOSGO|nr:hypothetical protein [Gossypium gossypioides]